MNSFKSGFISIIGRPNAGKSTLLNSIVKHKVAIVSPKAQTTRNKIQGIYSDDDCQIVFIDTPGIHKASTKLGEQLNKMAYSSTRDVEGTIFIVDASKEFLDGDKFVLEEVKELTSPVILVLNKIDLISESKLIEIVDFWSKQHEFKAIVPVSALNSENLENLLKVIKDILPIGPMYYPKESISAYPEKFIVSELIREKILYLTQEEIPHSVAVVVESMKKKNKDLYHIHATIIVDKDSKKGIIIGKGGQMLKKIGTAARQDIEELLGIRVMLELFVKVEKDWRDSMYLLKEYGYKDTD